MSFTVTYRIQIFLRIIQQIPNTANVMNVRSVNSASKGPWSSHVIGGGNSGYMLLGPTWTGTSKALAAPQMKHKVINATVRVLKQVTYINIITYIPIANINPNSILFVYSTIRNISWLISIWEFGSLTFHITFLPFTPFDLMLQPLQKTLRAFRQRRTTESHANISNLCHIARILY
jgi:hypothetical protein